MKIAGYVSRRSSLKSMSALGAAALLGSPNVSGDPATTQSLRSDTEEKISEVVWNTAFVDTHEHLFEEHLRLNPEKIPLPFADPPDDWSMLVGGYTFSDLIVAGLPLRTDIPWFRHNFFSPHKDPLEKWALIEPFWPFVKNTGYALALRLSVRELYGVDDLSADTIRAIQDGYERVRVPGFYRRILCDLARIESCQVNGSFSPFEESQQPTLLMQDLGILGMVARDAFPGFEGWTAEACRKATGIEVRSLSDWHAVIDWWFTKYGRFAVAVKSQLAYVRDIDYEQTPPEAAEQPFQKQLEDKPLNLEEQKELEDHLFWYAVRRATENHLPVKLHTGYYAGDNTMPLSRLRNNPGSACDLCRSAPETKFVFMHICYPYYEELISVAKQYTNAYLDMCWAWIVNPIAAKDFLKKYLVTAPANKVLAFGGDYVTVENVVGHAFLARRGITQALTELVEERWMSLDDALELVDPIMRGNARQLFRLEEKERVLSTAPWL